MNYPYQQSGRPAQRRIVSSDEATEQLRVYLNRSLNPLRDYCPMRKVRADLMIEFEKSFTPPQEIGWIIREVSCLTPEFHFEYDPRDDTVKFVREGRSFLDMPVADEQLPSSAMLPRVAAAAAARGGGAAALPFNLPAKSICDRINKLLREAKTGKFSVDRIHSDVNHEFHVNMSKEDLEEFICTHIETGDIQATMASNKCKMLVYQKEEDDDARSMRSSMSRMSVRAREDEERRRRRRSGEENKGGGGREDENGRRSVFERRDEEEDRERRGSSSISSGRGTRNGGEMSEEEDRRSQGERVREWKRSLLAAFPSIHHLPHLVFLLQRVHADLRTAKNGDWLYLEDWREHLDKIVGGHLDYSRFGLTLFHELVYHKVLEVNDRWARLSRRLAGVNVVLLSHYYEHAVYEAAEREGPIDYDGIVEYIDACDPAEYLKKYYNIDWKEEKNKVAEVRAVYKMHGELFCKDEKDFLTIDETKETFAIKPFHLI